MDLQTPPFAENSKAKKKAAETMAAFPLNYPC
jgi:hypothetical protein